MRYGSIWGDVYDDDPKPGEFGNLDIYGSDIDPGAGDTGRARVAA